MKLKPLIKILLFVVVVLLIRFLSTRNFEKIKIGTYKNDTKDSQIILYDDNRFSARITYATTGDLKIEMMYHGKYTQISESKLKLAFSINRDTEKRTEIWKIDKANNLLIDDNRNITFKLIE